MRFPGWAFVFCVTLGIVGLFVPALGVDSTGFIGKKASISLYTASTKRELTSRVFAAYHKAPGKGLGHALAKAVIPRAGKTLGGVLDDVKGAAETLDEVSDADIGLAGKALVGTVWILLALFVIGGLVMFGESVTANPPRMKRLGVAFGVAVVLAILSVGVMLVCREAVWQANDEIGKKVAAVGIGAYLILIGGLGALISSTAFLIMTKRSQRNAPTTSS